MAEELSAEDRVWIDIPIDVQVVPDEQKWLDTMLEMGKEEIYKYAIYNYGLEEDAVRASSKNGLLQLILIANRSGGGGAVLRTRYRYLNELKGILPPMVAVRKGGRLLYLTRGQGQNMQVLNKEDGEWLSYRAIAPDLDTAHATASAAANEPPAPKPSVTTQVVLDLLPKMNRGQLEQVATELGITDTTDLEKYPNNDSLRADINKVAGLAPTVTT